MSAIDIVDAISSAALFGSYGAYAFGLWRMVRGMKSMDTVFRRMSGVFSFFIGLAGISHALALLALWLPFEAVEVAMKFLTAVVSCVAAVYSWPKFERIAASQNHYQMSLEAQEVTGSRLRAILDAIPDLMFEISRKGKFVSWNTRGESYRSQDALDGMEFSESLPPASMAVLGPVMDAVFDGSHDGEPIRYPVDYKDGSRRWWEARAALTANDTAIFITRDITDAILREDALEAMNSRLQRFAYFASHDLQEPLRGMHGPAKILLEDWEELDAEERVRWLRHIHRNSQRAQAMVKDMLAFSRAGTRDASPEVFDSGKAVAEVIEGFDVRIAELDAKVEVSSMPLVNYDRTKFMAIIGNLLSNGLKFRRPGVQPVVKISGDGSVADMVNIRVVDNGIGIPKDQQSKIWQPGRRLHKSSEYPGNGLGLSSVSMIVEKCGGSLGIRSVVGQGTEFKLTIPGGLRAVE